MRSENSEETKEVFHYIISLRFLLAYLKRILKNFKLTMFSVL